MRVHIVYLSGGQVRVHRAGCRDIGRERTRHTTDYQIEVATQREAAEEFFSDFIAEGSMTPDDAWAETTVLPCTAGLPEGSPGQY